MPFPSDLRGRNRQPEVMDQQGLEDAEHHQALNALRRINRLSRTDRSLWPLIRGYCQRHRDGGNSTPVRLLDIATGGGDLPVLLWKKAKRAGLNLEVAGCDRSETALEYARAHARRENAEVAFFERDVIEQGVPTEYHIRVSSLFLHHLSEDEALQFLRALGNGGGLVLVDDLRRSVVGWLLAYSGVRLLSRSRVAHVDGPLSVEGAFTCEEARSLASRAGWDSFEVQARWPCRFLLVGGSS
ncbi:MAG: methyltransferase domain-containing protein [Isosphaeraceae bacterium]